MSSYFISLIKYIRRNFISKDGRKFLIKFIKVKKKNEYGHIYIRKIRHCINGHPAFNNDIVFES